MWAEGMHSPKPPGCRSSLRLSAPLFVVQHKSQVVKLVDFQMKLEFGVLERWLRVEPRPGVCGALSAIPALGRNGKFYIGRYDLEGAVNSCVCIP